MTHVSALLRGGMHCGTICLVDSESVSRTNLDILHEAGVVLCALRGPWVLSGNFNMASEMLRRSGWVEAVNGVIVATTMPTCNGAVYDDLVVSKGLEDVVLGVQRLDRAGLEPHYPVRLVLGGNARSAMARQLKRAPRVPATLPSAPLPEQPLVCGDINTTDELTDPMCTWDDAARREFKSLFGRDLAHADPRFVWLPAQGPVAEPRGDSEDSRVWRDLACRARELASGVVSTLNTSVSSTIPMLGCLVGTSMVTLVRFPHDPLIARRGLTA